MFPKIGAKPNQNDQHLRRVCEGGGRRSSLMPPEGFSSLLLVLSLYITVCHCVCSNRFLKGLIDIYPVPVKRKSPDVDITIRNGIAYKSAKRH